MRYQGKIVEWNDEKGFGFVLPNAGGRKIFVHLNDFAGRRQPQIGSLITFEMGLDAERRSCAIKAEAVVSRRAAQSAKQRHEARAAGATLSLWLAGIWAVAVVALTALSYYPWKLLAAWAAINAFTLIVYVSDKHAAERRQWRESEMKLHLLAFAGGWPAAAFAQQGLRHKTSKQSFRLMFWLTVIVNIGVMLWLASASGKDILRRLA